MAALGGRGSPPREICQAIWSLAIDPVDPNILFAGTRPAGVYRSLDGGQRWEKLPVDIARECSIGTPFVTALAVDPDDHRIVWAGVEIDGVFRSMDGGDTWTHLTAGMYDPDVHDMTIVGTRPKRLFVGPHAMCSSVTIWRHLAGPGYQGQLAARYARDLAIKADDPRVLFAGCGQTTTGECGYVLRTTDFGQRWEVSGPTHRG